MVKRSEGIELLEEMFVHFDAINSVNMDKSFERKIRIQIKGDVGNNIDK